MRIPLGSAFKSKEKQVLNLFLKIKTGGIVEEKLKPIWSLLKQTFIKWDSDNASWLAAALAYYTMFSLAPVVVIVIAVAGLLLGETAVQGDVQERLGQLIGVRIANLVQIIIQSANKPASGIIATIAGFIILLFGATNVFNQLQGTFNKIWKVKPKRRNWIAGQTVERLTSIIIVLSIGFLLLLSLIIDTILTGFQSYFSDLLRNSFYVTMLQVGNLMLSFCIIALLFAVIFKTMPRTKVVWNDVWIGAILTSFLFTVGKVLIGFYIGRSGIFSAFGAASSIIVILFWFYYCAQILLFGAEFTYVYANRFGSRVRTSK